MTLPSTKRIGVLHARPIGKAPARSREPFDVQRALNAPVRRRVNLRGNACLAERAERVGREGAIARGRLHGRLISSRPA